MGLNLHSSYPIGVAAVRRDLAAIGDQLVSLDHTMGCLSRSFDALMRDLMVLATVAVAGAVVGRWLWG